MLGVPSECCSILAAANVETFSDLPYIYLNSRLRVVMGNVLLPFLMTFLFNIDVRLKYVNFKISEKHPSRFLVEYGL